MRCIECEEIELARVRDAAPTQTLPIPAAALDGLPEGRDSGALTRRRLLQSGVAGFASVYGGSKLLGFEEVFEAAVADAAPAAGNCLVVLYLAGGNDSLNTMPPGSGAAAEFNAYTAARPTLGRVAGANAGGRFGTTDLPGTGGVVSWANAAVSGVSNNGGDAGFDTLFGGGYGTSDGNLAVLPGVDYTPANLSHFDSSDYWFSGALQAQTTGWLGRWIDRNGSASNPLQAISLDSALSKSIRTAVNPVCALPNLYDLGFRMNAVGGYGMPPYSGGPGPSSANINAEMAALAGMAAADGNAYLSRARSSYGQAVSVYNQSQNLGSANGGYPDTGELSTKLQMAARLLGAGLGTRIITIHWGSFDTHGEQLQRQDPQLQNLSRALAAFQADLTLRGLQDTVSTLVFSEFGRRVAENGTGTDHGAGGLVLLSGNKVAGGLASEQPSCQPGALSSGNLAVTTDFRAVYQRVLDEWLGGDVDGVMSGSFGTINRQQGSALFE